VQRLGAVVRSGAAGAGEDDPGTRATGVTTNGVCPRVRPGAHRPSGATIGGTQEEADEAAFFGGVAGGGERLAGLGLCLGAVVLGFGGLMERDVGGDVGLA
jgi:hypothetical protein